RNLIARAIERREIESSKMGRLLRTSLILQLARCTALVVYGMLLAGDVLAADWPQFRGPHRDGSWDETGILESFPKEGLRICWRHPVGGGFSSPVVSEGRAFVSDV